MFFLEDMSHQQDRFIVPSRDPRTLSSPLIAALRSDKPIKASKSKWKIIPFGQNDHTTDMFHPKKIPQRLMRKYANWEQTPGGILNELAQLLGWKIEYDGVDARTSRCPGPQASFKFLVDQSPVDASVRPHFLKLTKNIAGKQNDMFGIQIFICYENAHLGQNRYKIAFPVVRSLNKKGARSEAQAAACKFILGERDVQNKDEQKPL